MAVEAKRGCGYRKVGGLYLVGGVAFSACDRLPLAIEPCDVCGEEPRFHRGISRINPLRLWGKHDPCTDDEKCRVCHPSKNDYKAFLMWVGGDYTVEDFVKEALSMGVSKRIPALPQDFVVGTHRVYLAKKRLIPDGSKDWFPGMEEGDKRGFGPGIFGVWKPERLEKIVTDKTPEEELEALKKQGITPVVVPHDDPDHAARPKKEASK